MYDATSPTLEWRLRSVIHSALGLSTQAQHPEHSLPASQAHTAHSSHKPCHLLVLSLTLLPAVACHPQSFSVPLQIRLSGGRSRYEGRVEVQIGVPGHLRWGLICGDDWGTLEAMVACRQLGLGYANHGLQVSAEKWETKAVVTKVCALGKGLEASPLALETGVYGLTRTPPSTPPGDVVLGLGECN